ncbi:MAG: beta-N-acetylhexosaminidase, partial [Oscillospiraceae bacterium]|nr:beta-N-acetylhexosaminidase [Oscillospiraceae bacterium]
VLPKGVQMVYWDYYHHEEEGYKRLLTQHRKFGLETVFAGGIWVWNGVSTNYDQTFKTTNAALTVCKNEGAEEVFATMWGDNGAETCIYEGLLGLQLFAEHGYSQDVDNDRLRERFKACTNLDMNDFLALNDFDKVGQDDNLVTANPAKWLLWQDILIGLFDEHVLDDVDYCEYYKDLAGRMNNAVANSGEYGFIFEKSEKLAAVLALKADLGVKLKKAYDSKNLPKLSDYAQELLPELRTRVEELREVHMRQWFAVSKPFGWEVLDLRYGGLKSRIDTAIFRLIQYLNGDIESIPELEAERLSYDGVNQAEKTTLPRENLYHRIVSASNIIGV